MAKRKIIRIDEDKCDGCGLCIPNCREGALQLIDGKARLISDVFCDGLGACLGHCPQGAITIEEREADPFDEKKVEEGMHMHGGCPGAQVIDFSGKKEEASDTAGKRPSELRQWPIQLHLVPPTAPYFRGADVILSADCVAFAAGDFHKDHLKGKALAIACPKLDQEQDIYAEKIASLIDDAKINTLTVAIMEVPCCRGLLSMAQQGASRAKRKIPVKAVVLSLQGEVLSEEWV